MKTRATTCHEEESDAVNIHPSKKDGKKSKKRKPLQNITYCNNIQVSQPEAKHILKPSRAVSRCVRLPSTRTRNSKATASGSCASQELVPKMKESTTTLPSGVIVPRFEQGEISESLVAEVVQCALEVVPGGKGRRGTRGASEAARMYGFAPRIVQGWVKTQQSFTRSASKALQPNPELQPAANKRARSSSKKTPNGIGAQGTSSKMPDDIDTPHAKEPLAVAEYAEYMYQYYREREQDSVSGMYMFRQPHINERMRAILVDWLVEVHQKFKLVPDVLYLAVALIDRYLGRKIATRQNLQLVGVTCFWLASKYEEIYPPAISDLVYITDRAYTTEQIRDMELKILEALNFKLSFPTLYFFLLRYLKAGHADKRIVQLACYVAERLLQEYSVIKFLPSTIAACAVYIARRNLGRTPWSPTLSRYTCLNERDLRPCLEATGRILSAPGDLVAVNRKFSSQKYGAVACMSIEVIEH